jgi:hypothetical protein
MERTEMESSEQQQAEPQSMDEYTKRFYENQKIDGFGIYGTGMRVPCPFCAAPDFIVHKILETEDAYGKGGTCKQCGRSDAQSMKARDLLRLLRDLNPSQQAVAWITAAVEAGWITEIRCAALDAGWCRIGSGDFVRGGTCDRAMLVIDHIDGDSMNWSRENIRLLHWACNGVTPETRSRISATLSAQPGRPHTAETREKIRVASFAREQRWRETGTKPGKGLKV